MLSQKVKIGIMLSLNTKFDANYVLQVILFEINFYTNLHELFGQFISWTIWVNSGKFMDNCWISCQAMADMKKVHDDLIIINLYWYSRGGFQETSMISKLTFRLHWLTSIIVTINKLPWQEHYAIISAV